MKNALKRFRFSSGMIFGIVIGGIIFGSVGVAIATDIQSNTVLYETEANENVLTVEGALNDLYSKAENCGSSGGGGTLVEHILSLYTTDGDNNIYFHDKQGTYATYEAGDYSYRYSGASADVANYICFGSDAIVCPGDNLYRIIGVIDGEAKLIKATMGNSTELGTNGAYKSGTYYYWNNSTNNNTWSQSNLNTTNLNTNYVAYLNGIDTKWMNMIDTHTWKVGGNTYTLLADTAGAQNVYAKEITSPATGDTYSDEIGLMYVSDYMYGASPSNWSRKGSAYSSAASANWLYSGTTEWTIARRTDLNSNVFIVLSSGIVNFEYVSGARYDVRPVFYLKSNVYYNGGTGTAGDPYRISISEE